MRPLLALTCLAFLAAGATAQETAPEPAQQATPEGDWQDEFGTILRISYCGDGTQLCGVLIDIQGESRTEANLAYVNEQIMQAVQTGPNQWQGSVVFEGSEAKSTITQVAPDIIEIEGCRALILCETLAFYRMEGTAPAS